MANYSPKTLPFSNQCFPLVLFHRTHLMSKTIMGFTDIFSERVEFIFLTGPKGSTKRCFPRRILQRKSKMLSAFEGRLFVWSSINMAPWKPHSAKQHKVCYKGTKKARALYWHSHSAKQHKVCYKGTKKARALYWHWSYYYGNQAQWKPSKL